jgi:hypothetical protein
MGGKDDISGLLEASEVGLPDRAIIVLVDAVMGCLEIIT